MLNMDFFDRQIRLFGIETQEKLKNTTIIIDGTANNIASEITKCVILLGVKEIKTTQEIVNKTEYLIKNKLKDINEHVKITILPSNILEKEVNTNLLSFKTILTLLKLNKIKKTFNFSFIIDKKIANGNNFYYICSNCLTFIKNTYKHDNCTNLRFNFQQEYNSKCLLMAKEVLLGAMSVQEFIKIIEGKNGNNGIDQFTVKHI